MFRIFQRFSCAVTIAVLMPVSSLLAAPSGNSDNNDDCTARLLMEPSSGMILFEDNATTPLPPASMVKLMTTYVVLEQAQKGILSLDDRVTVSANASKIGGSQVYLKQGEEFSIQQLINALLVQSANDAAMALAERVGGTREGFVDLMNKTAKELGMNDSEFHSPHGLPPGKGQKPDVISARDMAVLSKALMKDFPQVLEYTKLTEADFRDGEFKMRNHNHLLRTFPDADGLKTGYYRKAGFSVSATAERNGLRMLAIVMGCEHRKKRDAEAKRLLQLGFTQYEQVTLIEQGDQVEQAVPVQGGTVASIAPVAQQTLTTFVQEDAKEEISRKVEACTTLQAPVAEGFPCGVLRFFVGEKEIASVDLHIPQAIPEITWKGRLKRTLGLN